MPDTDFDALCRYIETQLTEDDVEDRIFKILYKRHQKVVKAQNQVGVVQFANGLQIEILPKIALRSEENERAVLRQLLLKHCLISGIILICWRGKHSFLVKRITPFLKYSLSLTSRS